jgi:hypothetical protein
MQIIILQRYHVGQMSITNYDIGVFDFKMHYLINFIESPLKKIEQIHQQLILIKLYFTTN